MKIHQELGGGGNDFYATFICEHCAHVTPKRAGYHDGYFHNQVIPSWFCPECGKNRAGAKLVIKEDAA